MSHGFRDENEIKPLGYSVSLSDRVSMNVYMQVPDDIFDRMNAVVRFTYIYNNAERQYFMNHIWDNWGRA